MAGRMEGKVAVVTGAGRGLGRAHALLLAGEGARVVVNDIADADSVVEEIQARGGEAVADRHDIAKEPEGAVRSALDRWGTIDILVNNAGIGRGGEIDQMPAAEFDLMIDIHYRGTVRAVRAAWPVMRDKKYGRIVNTTSGSAIPGMSAPISRSKARSSA